MPEITFLFGMLFGVSCGLMLNKADKARMRWLEQERAHWRNLARKYRDG